MFEIGDWEVSEYDIEGSKIFVIDNFYANPDEVYSFCLNPLPDYWKKSDVVGWNSVKYEDRRKTEYSRLLIPIYKRLSDLCGQPPERDGCFTTNVTKFIDPQYNDFNKKDWWPHKDIGYNGIVYFDDSGTNLYSLESENPLLPEYMCPWVFKRDWDLIHTTEAQHNRCVLFDGAMFHHGMSVTNTKYFSEYRVNQVFFFEAR